jgi:predicted MPP superfamily phosphohydrolase
MSTDTEAPSESTGGRRLRGAALLRVVLFAMVGAVVAIAVSARTTAQVGPFDCTAVARPALTGSTTIRLAPFGTIELDTHVAPVAIELRVNELRPEEAEQIAADPSRLADLEDQIAQDAEDILVALARRAIVAAVVGGTLGALAARFRWRSALVGAGAGVLVAGGLAAVTVVTFRPEAVAEPRYTGLLTVAPSAIGDVEAVVDRFDDYREQLTELVANVVTVYRAAEGLPLLDTGDDAVRVLHVSDLHNNPQGYDLVARLAEDFDVDVVVDTGDISDWGTGPEALLVEQIAQVDAPYVFVRGNHDSRRIERAVAQQGAIVLDGEATEVAGLRIWGVGDPRFTPDKQEDDSDEAQRQVIEDFAGEVDELVAEDGQPIDIVALHDPSAAAELADDVPLVLAGHRHAPGEAELGDTLVLVEGSTGGAGLRGLQDEEPTPLSASVLYFDPSDGELVAYDSVAVEGLGGASVRIERHTVDRSEEP